MPTRPVLRCFMKTVQIERGVPVFEVFKLENQPHSRVRG